MILHLFPDDKVCNRIIANFEEVYPNQNIYICICDPDNLRFVNRNPQVNFVKPYEIFTRLDYLKNINSVVIHYLSLDKIAFIDTYLPNTTAKIFWAVWGADAYNMVLSSKGYDIYYDKRYVSFIQPKFKAKEIINGIFQKQSLKYEIRKTIEFIQQKVDFFLTSDIEYGLINKYLEHSLVGKCISESAMYYPIQDTLGALYGERVTGNNIMIGNSASFTNNHVYAFNYLSKLNSRGRQKITPISYGGSPEYIEHVKEIGIKLWGNDYVSLEKFIPLSEYNKLMLSVSHYIYGNWRQEAVGNIVIALYLGAKVFVSEKSPLQEIFRECDIHLYRTERITQIDLDTFESEENIRHNREAILELYSKESILKNIKRIFG